MHAGRTSARLRRHAILRLRVSYKTSKHIESVADECLDGFSKYEMKAYIESMQAAYLTEVEKWEEALDLLLRSKTIY